MAIESRPSRRFLSEAEAAPILAQFERADANSVTLEREWTNLLREHRGEWVAVDAKGLLFADELEGIIDLARAKGWPLDTTIFRFIAERELTV